MGNASMTRGDSAKACGPLSHTSCGKLSSPGDHQARGLSPLCPCRLPTFYPHHDDPSTTFTARSSTLGSVGTNACPVIRPRARGVVARIDADECTQVERRGAIVRVRRCGQGCQGGGERLRRDALPAEAVPEDIRQGVQLAGSVAEVEQAVAAGAPSVHVGPDGDEAVAGEGRERGAAGADILRRVALCKDACQVGQVGQVGHARVPFSKYVLEPAEATAAARVSVMTLCADVSNAPLARV